MRNPSRTAALILLLSGLPLLAQWKTESYVLKGGWNGKTYSLEASSDTKNWVQVSHYTSNPEPTVVSEGDAPAAAPVPQFSYEATNTHAVEIFSGLRSDTQTFYRLQVR